MSDKNEAKKPAGRSIEDVKRPGKTAAGPTSKPVILTNRPILQDPMVVAADSGSDPDAEKPSSEAAPTPTTTSAKSKVQPLTAPELEPAEAEAEPPAEPDEPEASKSKPVVGGEKVIAPLKLNDKTDAEEKPKAEAEDAEATDSDEDTPKPTEEAASSSEPAPEDKPTSEAAEEQSKSDEKKADAAQSVDDTGAEAKAEIEHDEAVQKLIDSKKNFLPINSIEKRRAKQVVLLGVLLCIVLAVAWVDIALDAGIIHLQNIKPVTHFFSN